MVVLLVALLAVITVSGFLGTRKRAESKAVAIEFVAALEAAREVAQSSGFPTGFLFPSGSVGVAGYSILGGAGKGRIAGSYRWDSQYDNVRMVFPPGSASGPRSLSFYGETLDVEAWLGPLNEQRFLVFGPNGQVATNLPLQPNGALQILVCSGYTSELTKVFAPYSIFLAGATSPELLPGVGNLAIEVDTVGTVGVGAAGAPLAGQRSDNLPPRLVGEPELSPPQDPDVLAALTPPPQATVAEGRNLQITVNALDPEGDPLLFEWSEQDNLGGFSVPTRSPMIWSPRHNHFTGIATWQPPASSAPGDRFLLHLSVVDAHGLQADLGVYAEMIFEVAEPGKIIFSLDSGGQSDLYTIKSQGSDRIKITDTPFNETYPRWSPDGRFIAYLGDPGGANDLFVCHANGLYPIRLVEGASLGGSISSVGWSPDGSSLGFTLDRGTRFDTYSIRADGTHPDNDSLRQPKMLAFDYDTLPNNQPRGTNWNPQGTGIIVTGRSGDHPPPIPPGNGSDFWEIPLDGSSARRVTNSPGGGSGR